MWTTHLEKEAGQSSHMTHSHLPCTGPNPGKLYPSFCACSIPTHMSPLNAGQGGTAPLNHRCATPWEHHGGLFAHARPFAHIDMWVDAKTGTVGIFTLFPTGTRAPQAAVRHAWALPRPFFEMCCPAGSPGHG